MSVETRIVCKHQCQACPYQAGNEQMRKVGSKGAPTAKAFKQSARTAKRKS
jgi:hypothetical protein